MNSLATALFSVHPLVALAFLVLMANGLLAPALYSWRRQAPYDIGLIRKRARTGERFARYAYFSWLLFVLAGALTVVVMVLAAVRK